MFYDPDTGNPRIHLALYTHDTTLVGARYQRYRYDRVDGLARQLES